jgi:twitching motility protein PilU
MDLSLNLKAVISQRLIKTVDQKGRRAATEILINTPLMADLMLKGEIHSMRELISKSREHGMQTFDQALFELIEEGSIGMEEGLRHADSVNDLRLRLKLEGKRAKSTNLLDEVKDLRIS